MAQADKRGSGSLRQNAYETILQAIIFGDLAPGSSIDDKQVADDFGLGLAVVRDALMRLALENMVERHARIGTRVPDLGLREVQEVFEARVILEGACAALAAERASAVEVEALRASFAGYEEVIERREFRRLVAMDQAFHRTLADACHNGHMGRSLVLLHNNASRFWYFGLLRLDAVTLRADIKAHLVVADAIAAHDAVAAEQAMRGVLGHFPADMRNFLIAPPIFDRLTATREAPAEPKARPAAEKPPAESPVTAKGPARSRKAAAKGPASTSQTGVEKPAPAGKARRKPARA
ncbi:GntR family transcriptional regulator [Chelatococcus reniformis]|uniref:HTH gntR-type domain-containing protein n=1 Tax=Chelatococcus reniformis TaxID=1494448 RepID=A0A916USZ4_9HYPH|nr:GntR family transcriptional regulator [Chelatococcus reniformis]GGC86901.1 hypothetical protein GCM10010994_51030 [Chelatococcus reniformis]